MTEDTSRLLDAWVGKPVCAVLTGLRRARRALGARRPAPDGPRKILFVKLSEMGAILLAMPAFEAARSRVGRENLYCLMLGGNREVHELIDAFPAGNLLTLRDRNLVTFALDVLRTLRRCRRESIDTVIDLEGFARISAILGFLSGASRRVGLHRFDLLTHRVAYNPYQHASLQFLTLVEALDSPDGEWPLLKRRVELKGYRLPRYVPTAQEVAEAEALLERRTGALPSRPWVILNCNLIDALPLRRWPRESFRELGRRILAHHPAATLLLTGLAAEREQSRALAAEISPERALPLAGDTPTLRSLVVLIELADLLVTSDCGPAHMAALTATPIVSIFGPETPHLYAPLSAHNHSLWAELACSPCFTAWNHRKSPCRDNVCMRRVSVDQAWETVRRACPALDAPGPPASPSSAGAAPA
jgi:ADP-heptose:LPS heptosyltransferase